MQFSLFFRFNLYLKLYFLTLLDFNAFKFTPKTVVARNNETANNHIFFVIPNNLFETSKITFSCYSTNVYGKKFINKESLSKPIILA